METKNKKKVIGIILANNCGEQIEALYKSLPHEVLDMVIITNDESGDNTEEVARDLGIPCFSHPRLNYGGNMKYGMAKAIELGADYMVEIHGDGQYDVSFIKPAVEKIKEGYGLVLGSRFTDLLQPLRDKMSIIRYLANVFLSLIDRLVLGVRVSEFHTGARVYSREAIQKVDLKYTANNFLFSFQIIAQIAYHNFKIGEVPARCYYDQENSSISLKNSAIYAFATFVVLFYYVLARIGFQTKLFHK